MVHKPGMAKEMLENLAPLLAEEGIDFDDPDGVDLDRLDAAMALATERHNLELFTPVGAQRADALQVLADFSELISGGFVEAALAVVENVPIDPGARTAAVSHVIGAGLGRLDEWEATPDLRGIVATATALKVPGVSRSSAREILLAAREGEAFASIDHLIRYRGGKEILEGTMLAVASVMAAIATAEGTTPAVVSRELLTGERDRRRPGQVAPRASVFGAGASGGGHAPAGPIAPVISMQSRITLRAFSEWVESTGSVTTGSVKDEVALLRRLFKNASQDGLDPCLPADIEFVAELIFDTVESESLADELAEALFMVLDNYIHFQIDQGEDSDEWLAVHADVERIIGEFAGDDALPEELTNAMVEAEELDPDDVRAALAGTRIVSAVSDLLEWIGTSRPITSTRSLRRVDIEYAASLLGVAAVGSSTRPWDEWERDPFGAKSGSAPAPRPLHAQSMWEVPLLSTWWQALSMAELIELRSTRVRPGAEAEEWKREDQPPTELASKVVAAFVSQWIADEYEQSSRYFSSASAAALIGALMQTLSDEPTDSVLDEEALESFHLDILDRIVRSRMAELGRTGLVVPGESEGEWLTPAPLRGAMARGIMIALAILGYLRGERG